MLTWENKQVVQYDDLEPTEEDITTAAHVVNAFLSVFAAAVVSLAMALWRIA